MSEEIKKFIEIEKGIKRRADEIVGNYNFEVPYYIASEIAVAESKGYYNNVLSLIGLARINERISDKDAKILVNDIRRKNKQN